MRRIRGRIYTRCACFIARSSVRRVAVSSLKPANEPAPTFPLNVSLDTLDDTQAAATSSSPIRGWCFAARNKILPAPTVPILYGRYFKRAGDFHNGLGEEGGSWVVGRSRGLVASFITQPSDETAIMSARWYLIFVAVESWRGTTPKYIYVYISRYGPIKMWGKRRRGERKKGREMTEKGERRKG